MRVVVLSMVGPYGGPALAALLAAGAEVVAVAVPAPPGAPPVARLPALGDMRPLVELGPRRPPTLLSLAAAHGLPALALGRRQTPALVEALAAFSPDLLVVACWPWRLPQSLLDVARLGALNLHPSPLPELRGPAPLFWAFYEGRGATAVTLHWMDAGLDTGPIALQRPLALPAGLGWDEAEALAAELGAALLGEAVEFLAREGLPRRAQGQGGSFRPAPGPDDFALDGSWTAERAFRFLRGTAAWGLPYLVRLEEGSLQLREARGFRQGELLGAPCMVAGAVALVQLRDGVLEATVA